MQTVASAFWVELNATSLHIKNMCLNALNQQSLFQRFAVSLTETTTSGLGLALVREFVNDINGG